MYCDDFASLGVAPTFQHGGAFDRILADQRVIELVDVPLFEILETEVRAEETRRTILQRNPAVAFDRRRPHPLIGGAIRRD